LGAGSPHNKFTKMRKKLLFKILPTVVLVFSLLLNFFLLSKNLGKKYIDSGVYIRDVIDGDTLVTETGSRIRLLRGDAPEIQFCMGKEAKDRLYELTVGKRVILKDQSGDNFGRILALAYVGDDLINEILIREGLLRYEGGSSSEKERLQTAADIARKNKSGIYSSKCRQTENLDNPKCVIKGNIDKSSGKKTYHFPGCSGYENKVVVEKDIGESWFCSEKEAKAAGFEKSQNCYNKTFKQN